MQPRIALETLLALGAADAGVDCERLPRATARVLLGLPKKGELYKMAGEVAQATGQLWAPRKRDLAAIAAVAAHRQG